MLGTVDIKAIFMTQRTKRSYIFKDTEKDIQHLLEMLERREIKDVAIVHESLWEDVERGIRKLTLGEETCEVLPKLYDLLKDKFNVLLVDEFAPLIKEGAPSRRPGERRIDYLAYLLLLGKLESGSLILSEIKSMKKIKEARIVKAPKVKTYVNLFRVRVLPSIVGIVGIIIGAFVWSFTSRLLIELKVLLTGSLLLRALLGEYTIPKVEAELWTKVLIVFILCVVFAAIAGTIAGGLGHFAIFSKKRWEEKKKFNIASTIMGIVSPVASLLFGYLLMFGAIIERYFTILFQ
jgi:hypothetical protein